MKLKQLSVFIENAPGRLSEVTQALGDVGINLRSLSISDTLEFGVLRILVSDLNLSRRVLMEKQISARIDDVVAVELDDIPGSLADVLSLFIGSPFNINYMYTLAGSREYNGKAVMIFRFSDNDRAIEILQDNNVILLTAKDIGIIESIKSIATSN
jgi:hypothetical protein